eukprot:350499-Chlamydomonas_euryale.AAC.2
MAAESTRRRDLTAIRGVCARAPRQEIRMLSFFVLVSLLGAVTLNARVQARSPSLTTGHGAW